MTSQKTIRKKTEVNEVGSLRCNGCGYSIFRIFRDPDTNTEWAVCVECDAYTIVTHLQETKDDYLQMGIHKK